MKKTYIAFAAALMGLLAPAATSITVRDGETARILSPGKIVHVRVLSSVATGTATLKSAAAMPVVSNVEHYHHKTNFTYTVTFTNGAESVTETYNFPPLPLGPTVTAYATNAVVSTVTNLVPTASSVVVATNSLSATMTCAAGTASDSPTGKFVIPGDVIFFDGTAKGRADVIIED